MTSDNFMTGILASLALQNHRILDGVDRKFDESMAAAYNVLVTDLQNPNVDVDFQVSPDPIHGDSEVVQESLTLAVQGRVVTRVNPTFRKIRIILREDRAKRLLDRLPGESSVYEKLADTFWSHYNTVTESATA